MRHEDAWGFDTPRGQSGGPTPPVTLRTEPRGAPCSAIARRASSVRRVMPSRLDPPELEFRLRRLIRSLRPAFQPDGPSTDSTSRVGGATRVGLVLVGLGLFSFSWERLLNVPVGPYNVKLPSIAFSLAVLVLLPRLPALARRLRGVRVALAILAALLVWLTVASLLAADVLAAVAQLIAIATNALAPAAALLLALDSLARVRWGAIWLVAGAYVAAVFGLYQLAAFYLHLPQGVVYTGEVLGSTGFGRIAAFSYEPAYFADALVIAIGARILLALTGRGRIRWFEYLFLALVLELASVRALVLILPVLAVLLLLRWRRTGGVVLRGVVAAAIVVGAFALGGQVVPAVMTALSPAGAAPDTSQQTPDAGPADTGTPNPSATVPDTAPQESNLFDPNEVSSNSVRLDLYRSVIPVITQHLAFGVGPGNLGRTLHPDAPPADQQATIANNVWLQAAADGGVPAVLLEAAFLVAVLVQFLRRRTALASPMFAAVLTVVGVGGMLTSYYFDMKVWVGLGLAWAMLLVLTAERGSGTASAPGDVADPSAVRSAR